VSSDQAAGAWRAPVAQYGERVTGTRRERARQQTIRRRLRYVRVAFVASVMLIMLAPSLRAPNPVTGASGQRASAADDPLAGAGAAAAVSSAPRPQHPMGTLRVPALGLDAVYYSGLHRTTLERGPGHWPGTPLPGGPGNAVMSGHRTAATAPFAGLDLLAAGDEVRVTTGGVEIVYHVFETLIVDAEAYVDVVLAQPAGPADRVLTLFACHPKGSTAQRIVVRARASG